MEPGFWLGLFGLIGTALTAVAATVKNISQDRRATKIDERTTKQEVEIAVLKTEVKLCQEERERLLDRLEKVESKETERPSEDKQ